MEGYFPIAAIAYRYIVYRYKVASYCGEPLRWSDGPVFTELMENPVTSCLESTWNSSLVDGCFMSKF